MSEIYSAIGDEAQPESSASGSCEGDVMMLSYEPSSIWVTENLWVVGRWTLKCGTHCQQSQLLPKPATTSTVADMVDFFAGFGDKSATTLIWQLVAVDIVAKLMDFVANTVDFVARMSNVLSTLSP